MVVVVEMMTNILVVVVGLVVVGIAEVLVVVRTLSVIVLQVSSEVLDNFRSFQKILKNWTSL